LQKKTWLHSRAATVSAYNKSKNRADMSKTLALTLSLAACLLTPWSAQAEKADRQAPMHIEADSMRHQEADQITQFHGKVVATKGTLVLRAAHVTVKQFADGRQLAELTPESGERVFFRQKREGLDEFVEGEAEWAQYDSQADVLTLQRRAELRTLRGSQLADRVQGNTIVFSNTTETYTVDGLPRNSATTPGQRVKATLKPREQSPATDTSRTSPAPQLRTSPSTAQ
jgi:lipopolysaccharide export system protein LptA